ncbi:hypothetical protein N9917_01600 [Deltaproteobacteria bacterium]|nr:hypothetical protein [Deltaproteobacteria bacterium]
MDLPDPTIYHDHMCGIFPRYRYLLDEAAAGRISAHDAVFATFDGGVNKALTLSFMLLAEYRQYGQQTFVVGPHLQQMFERTSLEGVPGEMLKMPFPCLYVALPECDWEIWGGVTGWHKVTGLLVRYDEPSNSFTLFIWGAENENARTVGDDASFWLNLDMNEAEEMGLDVETYLLTVMNDRERESSDDHDDVRVEERQRREVYDKIEDTAINVSRVVFNLLIYLQSQTPERTPSQKHKDQHKERKDIERQLGRIKNPNKRKTKVKHLRRRLEQLSDATVTWIGESIERTVMRGGIRHPGRKQIRHWVRGHWWPRLNNTEAIKRWGIRWKQPFEKNKDSKESEPSRHYHFKEDTDEVPRPEESP